MADHRIWPARNVAEYAYCPRLFYFMEVEGLPHESVDVEQGRSLHSRVDRPSQAPGNVGQEEYGPDRPKILRSLTLTSAALKLTATLDLAQVSGKKAVPIEYRKGRPKRSVRSVDAATADEIARPGVEPWPTDRIQLGLQAILLQDAGYTVNKVLIYYAAEKRKLTVRVDDQLKRDALDTLTAAIACAQGPRPSPLVNDARCRGCSLEPFCLPEEINYLRDPREFDEPNPRVIWPLRDEDFHVVVQTVGAHVGVKGGSLRITDTGGGKLKEVPLASVGAFSIFGSVQVSTQALAALAARNIPIGFHSTAGRLVAMVDPLDAVSAQVRRAQIHKLDEPAHVLQLSRVLVRAKIANQRTLLMRNHAGLPQHVLGALSEQIQKVTRARSLDVLRGHEGIAARIYFEHFPGIFKGTAGEQFAARGRQRRPPPDPINSCLSMGYTMLAHECVSALRMARLEPSIGAFHVSRPGRPALALDLMEPFRPLIADSVAISAFNRGELQKGHFRQTAAGCLFTDEGRRAFFNAYGRRMDTEVTHPIFKYRLSYRRMISLHARMIAAWMIGEISTLHFLTTR
ncbi:MAG: CRISPR-associated endonuclease Cas4g/Cas1g [Thermodesulfobacteriota bacterium]